MKTCPYCAEEIQDSAVKCRYCGEWLNRDKSAITSSAPSQEVVITETSEGQSDLTVSAVSPFSSTAPQSESVKPPSGDRLSSKKQRGLGNWTFILMPVSLLLVDFAMGAIYSLLSNDISEAQFWVISYVALILLGIGWAAETFKRKYWKEILVTVLVLFLIRLVSTLYLAPEYLGTVLIRTSIESSAFVASLIAFSFLYSVSERKLRFGCAKDVVIGLTDAKTKLKYDAGRCSNCKEQVVLTKSRSKNLSGIFGESRHYLCPKCGVYIGGNPIVSIFMGIVEAGACVLLAMSFAAFHRSGRWGPESYLILALLIGVLDGLKRSVMGLVGLVKALRGLTNANIDAP